VVGLQNHKEADRIVRLLTPENGRITALGRSARSSTKRFGGALDIGNRLEVTLRPPKAANGWWGLDAATLEDGRAHVRSDLERLSLLAYCTEVCGQLARENHPEPKLFGLLDMALSLLDAMTQPPGALFRIGLETKALTFAGVGPQLSHCVTCGGSIDDPAILTPQGASHMECGQVGVRVNLDWLEAAEKARRTPLRDVIDLPLRPGPSWVFAEAIEAHLGRRLRSRSILATLSE
jgi:DNA repair protein RecO